MAVPRSRLVCVVRVPIKNQSVFNIRDPCGATLLDGDRRSLLTFHGEGEEEEEGEEGKEKKKEKFWCGELMSRQLCSNDIMFFSEAFLPINNFRGQSTANHWLMQGHLTGLRLY